MKVAIVHDYIKEYGGAERVLEELMKIYPKADIYTSLYSPSSLGPHRARFAKFRIHESFFRYIPFAHKLISPLRTLSPLAFSSFDLSSYDVVLVSQTGAYFPNFVKKGSAQQICYTHTPPRYLYGYMTAREWKKNPFVRVVAEVVNHFLRIVDYHASLRVDQFIANSEEVRRRIEKFYRREATVIYPPVKVSIKKQVLRSKNEKNENFKQESSEYYLSRSASSGQDNQILEKKGGYYLAGGRLARAKGMDIIVDAFIENGKPLKIFGKGFAGYNENLKLKIQSSKSDNIELLEEVSDEEKLVLMGGAKAYIFASYDEDFGITPVEAMSVGTPVVAYKSGGVQETVVEGKTGVFYSPNIPDALNKAVRKLEKLEIKPHDCIAQAKKFSDERFRKAIAAFVSSHV